MYSHRLLRDVCGLEDVDDGVVRVSLLHYNTGEWISLLFFVPCLKLRGWRAYARDQGGGTWHVLRAYRDLSVPYSVLDGALIRQ